MRQRLFRPSRSPALRRTRLLAIFIGAFLLCTLSHAELAVILHPSVPITKLSKEEVARIFMKKSKTLPNGYEVIPVSQASRAEINEHFFAAITRQDRMQRDAYWARLLFTGKGRPPEDLKNVKERVASDRRYIGYIDAKSVDKTVKAVYRMP